MIDNLEAQRFVAEQFPQYQNVSFEKEGNRNSRGHYDLDSNNNPLWGFFVEVESQNTLKIYYYLNEGTLTSQSFENPLLEKRFHEFMVRVLNKSLAASDEPVDCSSETTCSAENWQLVRTL